MKKVFLSIIFSLFCISCTDDIVFKDNSGLDSGVDNHLDANELQQFYDLYSDVFCMDPYKKHHDRQSIALPRKLYLNTGTMDEKHIDLALESINIWNNEMRYIVLVPVITDTITDEIEKTCGNIIVNVGTLSNDEWGHAWWNSCNGKVIIDQKTYTTHVYVHEFGHILNLAHEDDMESIMNSIVFINNDTQKISDMSKCLVGLSILENEYFSKEIQNSTYEEIFFDIINSSNINEMN